MGEFIDFLIVVIVIYYIAKALFRIFVPMLFENAVNKAQQQQQGQQYRANNNQQQQYRAADNKQYYTPCQYQPGQIKSTTYRQKPKERFNTRFRRLYRL